MRAYTPTQSLKKFMDIHSLTVYKFHMEMLVMSKTVVVEGCYKKPFNDLVFRGSGSETDIATWL